MELADLRDPAALERPIVRAGYCRHLVELLAEEGIAPEITLAGTGLRFADLADEEHRISHASQLRIYENAVARTRTPGLGFRLGHRERISDHGVIGYAIQSSANLAQAIRIALRYMATAGPLLSLELVEDGGEAGLIAREIFPLGRAGRMAREELTTILVEHLLALTSPPTRPLEARFDLPGGDDAFYEAELGCPVRFDAPHTEIRFRARDLLLPLAFSDAETAEVCEQRCAELLERLGETPSLVARVRRELVGAPGRIPSLEETARALGMSGRTLRRRLKDAGTSFHAVEVDVRKGLALDYLQRSTLSVDEIANLLGYSETPNFYRAFKRWTGRPPGAFR